MTVTQIKSFDTNVSEAWKREGRGGGGGGNMNTETQPPNSKRCVEEVEAVGWLVGWHTCYRQGRFPILRLCLQCLPPGPRSSLSRPESSSTNPGALPIHFLDCSMAIDHNPHRLSLTASRSTGPQGMWSWGMVLRGDGRPRVRSARLSAPEVR